MFYKELVCLDNLRRSSKRREVSSAPQEDDDCEPAPEWLIDLSSGVDSRGNVHIPSFLDPARVWRLR